MRKWKFVSRNTKKKEFLGENYEKRKLFPSEREEKQRCDQFLI
jgi:hypothetical protein